MPRSFLGFGPWFLAFSDSLFGFVVVLLFGSLVSPFSGPFALMVGALHRVAAGVGTRRRPGRRERRRFVTRF